VHPSRHPGVIRSVRTKWIVLSTILAGFVGFIAWRMFNPGDFNPRITATLLENSLTNDIGYTVWVESTDPWAFKPKASQFLMSFIEPEDPYSMERFLTSDPILLGDRTARGETFDLR
jgi:hypothetical protein